jgi:hypothetical protein
MQGHRRLRPHDVARFCLLIDELTQGPPWSG